MVHWMMLVVHCWVVDCSTLDKLYGATLWGEHRVVGTRSQLPPPLADLDDDDYDDYGKLAIDHCGKCDKMIT